MLVGQVTYEYRIVHVDVCVRVPYDMFGSLELIAEFDPMNRMRIRHLLLNLRSTFKLAVA
jgi:hypothetical protein